MENYFALPCSMRVDNQSPRRHSEGKPIVGMLSPSATDAAMSSERDLWAAVLGLAIEDLTDSRTGAQALCGTRIWFASDDYEPASFLWICDQLEIDALTVRRRVIEIVGVESPSSKRAEQLSQRSRERADASSNAIKQ